MVDVFISYSHRHAAERVRDLLASEGWSVWFDRAIRAGAAWSTCS